MNSKLLFWMVLAVTLGVYAAMVLWTLPKITADANGLLVFDLRPGGYSFQEAKEFLAALSVEGNEYYRRVQQRLDTAFPLLNAISTGWAIFLLAPTAWGKWRNLLSLIPIPGMVFDYLENANVAALLEVGAEGITAEMVAKASFYSQSKAGSVTLSLMLLLSMIVLWFIRWRRRKSIA